MDKLFINYSGNIESFKRLGLEETYKKCIVFIEKGGAIYTHNTYYAGPDIIKSIQEALGELQAEIKEGDYVSSIKQVDGKIEATMGTFEGRDSKILEDSMSYTDELKRDATKAITTEYIRATGVEKSLSERIDSHLDITERALSEKADKDSVYDKDQIDLKLTGVYKIKGSCTFEELPETNKVGDVYNITNSFTLDEEEHTAGTNIVYTENGWDVLAGIFDTSAIELDIQRVSNLLALEAVRAIKAENDLEDKINEGAARAQEKELELDKKFDNYLPLSGGIITNTSNTPIKIKTTSGGWSGLAYSNKDGIKGHIGVWQNGDPVYVPGDLSKGCTILHQDNYSNYALPLKGGTINGRLQINRSDDSHTLVLNTEKDSPAIAFKSGGDTVTRLVADKTSKYLCRTNIDWSEQYRIWDSGNFNPSDYLPLSGGIINAKEKSPLKITGGNYGEISIGVFKDGNEMSVFGYAETLGTFMWDNVSHSRLYIRNNKLFFTPSAYAAAETIWHSGNDGEGSGLDADKLDGYHSGYFAKSLSDVGANNVAYNALGYTYSTTEHGGYVAGGLIYAGMNGYGMLLNGSFGGGSLAYRGYDNGKFTGWKTIAFTDSTVANATMLDGTSLDKFVTNTLTMLSIGKIARISLSQNSTYLITLRGSNTGRDALVYVSGYNEGTTDRITLKVIYSSDKYKYYINGRSDSSCIYIENNNTSYDDRLTVTNLSGVAKPEITKLDILPEDAVLVNNSNNVAYLNSNVASATKATQDSEGNVITDTYALKSDVIIGENITDGVYAVKADGSLCTVDKADTSCIGAALIVDDHKFMIAKSDATNDGSNYNLNWEYTLTDTSLPNHPYVYNTSYEEGYLPNANGEYTSTPNLPNDYTLWNYGSLSEFDGKSNTAIVSNISNNSKDIFTVLKTFNQEEQASGRSADWYVPALGQLALIYLNITDINNVLTKIGGTTLRNNSYWSSTENSANFAWIVNFSNGYVYISRKVHYGYVSARFIKNIQIESPKSVKESITEIKNQLKQPASALKLSTPIKLWGNDFDGSSDINNHLNDVGIIYFNKYGGDLVYNIDSEITGFARGFLFKNPDGSRAGYIGGYGEKGVLSYLFLGKDYSNQWLTILPNGNVGIGTTNPQYKLDVNGVINAKTVIGGNNTGYYLKDKNGDSVRTLCITTENALLLGHDTASLNYATVIDGSMIALRCNTTHSNALIINPSGNVTIGKSDLALTNYKLYVDGLLHTNSLSIQSDTKVDNLNADKLDGYEAEDFALKSDVEVEVEVEAAVENGVYAVTADGKLIDYNSADITATGVALVAGKHRFMIAKSDATDGTNTTLYWGKDLKGKDVAGVVTNTTSDGTNSYAYLPKPDGTYQSTPNLSGDFTTWTAGALAEFNGKSNTDAIFAAYTEHGVSMNNRDMCSVLKTFNASDSYNDWYVPAFGQLALIYLNKTEINAALSKIGSTALVGGYYWSSSGYSSDIAWNMNFNDGYVSNYGKGGS